MKTKFKLIIIGFLVLMIPIGFVIKRAIAIEIQKKAIELFHFGSSKKDFEKSIKKIDLAIKLAPKITYIKRPKLNFYNQNIGRQ